MHTKHRIVILAEGKFSPFSAKTAAGVIRYSPHEIVAVIDSTQAGKTVQDVMGYGGSTPIVRSIYDSMPLQPDVLLIGIAPTGGQLPAEFRHVIADAIENHLEIWSGLHFFLSNDEEFAELADRKGVRIWDVRRPSSQLEVARGAALNTRAYVCLMVGSDCNVGKMTTALELQREFRKRGYKAGFVATGQTGILIEGEGTPLDAVPGDFMSGEVERLVMACDQDGDEIIFVEGQGAVVHPGFGPVTLGLILGSMPDSYILCHHASRKTYRPDYDIPLPPLPTVVRQYEVLMEYFKAPKVVGVAVNTYDLSEADATSAMKKIADELQLPTLDPIRNGVQSLANALEPLMLKKFRK
jgi:uncharacterized NAD-dependent epimerase/dehydratase family protein